MDGDGDGARVRVRVDWLKVTGPSMAWCNGTTPDGAAVSVLFKGKSNLAALRADALATPCAQLLIEATAVRRKDPAKSPTGAVILHATEYHGRQAPPDGPVEDWHSVLACTGKRSCDVRWAPREEGHAEDEPKEERHRVFARWLCETFGAESLRRGSGVVDVAGGAGGLSTEIHALAAAACTVIDPLEDFEHDGVQYEGRTCLPESGRLIRERFDAAFVRRDAATAGLLARCSLLCAMHPDQATEAVVDAALRLGKPFAVVPCCVFAAEFPARRRRNGDGVCAYGSLLDYLQEKDGRIERANLTFRGRNVVLFLRGAPPAAEGARTGCPLAPPGSGGAVALSRGAHGGTTGG